MNQPTQAILQKYGISPTPNPPQAVSGNAQVRNINSSTVNNQVNNKIIIIQPQIPIAQPNIQLKDTQGESLRNWISNQFKAQQQKYQEENNYYKKYGERITDGIQRVTRSITSATERFAENMNPQKLSQTMTDSKKVLVMMFLAILATKFIGPLSRRIDKFYKWFTGDGNKVKGFVEKFKEIFFPDNKEDGILGKLKKGIGYGLSLLKGYVKLAIDDRVRALSELRQHDLKDISFDISEIPSMLLKVFAALIGGSKGLGFVKTRAAGRKLKKKILENFKKYGGLKNDFDSLGNVKNEQNSVYRVQKKIESLIQDAFKKYTRIDVSISHILSLLEALTGAVFTCYQYDDKLVRGTLINNAKNFLTLLGYYEDEISQLFEKEYIVDIKSIVEDRNNSTKATGNQVITEEGWKVMAVFFNAERVSVSDRNYYDTFEKRLIERWKAFWKEKLAGNEKAISIVDQAKLIDPRKEFIKDELGQLRRAWDFNDELEAARQSDREIFEHENQEALNFFRGVKNEAFGDEDTENLEEVDQFNENNYQEVEDGEFNTELAAQEVRKLSFKKFDKNHNVVCRKPENQSSGHCAMHVRMAIEKGGVDLDGHPASAYEYMTFLPKKGFKLIHSGRKRDLENPNVYPFSNDLKKGDVVVFNRTATHPDGHIAIYDGQNWYADYKHGTWHGLGDKGFDQFGVFRFTSTKSPQGKLEEAQAASKEQPTNKEARKELAEAMYYKKTDTLPESAAPSGTTSTTTKKNLGKTTTTPSTPSTKTTSKQQSTGKLSEANPDSHVATYGESVEDLALVANPEIKVNTYARKGTTQQRMLHHTMRASYVSGIKTD